MDDVVTRSFHRGMQQDPPIDQLPPGVAHSIAGFLPSPNAHSPLRKRGGWVYASKDLNAVSAITRVESLGWAPFTGDPHLVIGSNNGKVFNVKVSDGTDGTLVSTSGISSPTHPWFWHKDRLIQPAARGSDVNPKKYYDTGGAVYAVADVGGTPPHASCGCSWGDYLVLGNGYVAGTRYANRIWFSNVGNPDAWTTATSYWDFPEEVIAIIPRQNGLLVLGYTGAHYLTGDTPPPGGNLSLRKFQFAQGTLDVRSVAVYNDFVIFANNVGVFRTDGSTVTDLTEVGGISNLWRDNLAQNVNPSTGWRVIGGCYRGCYFIALLDQNGIAKNTLICDLGKEAWWLFAPAQPTVFASRAAGSGTASEKGSEELFFGTYNTTRVGRASDMWSPTTANRTDGDGSSIQVSLVTPFYKEGSPTKKRFRRAFLTYDMRDGASVNPYILPTIITSPEKTSWATKLPPTPGKVFQIGDELHLPPTTQSTRVPLTINKKIVGISFAFVVNGDCSDLRIYELELDTRPLGPNR